MQQFYAIIDQFLLFCTRYWKNGRMYIWKSTAGLGETSEDKQLTLPWWLSALWCIHTVSDNGIIRDGSWCRNWESEWLVTLYSCQAKIWTCFSSLPFHSLLFMSFLHCPVFLSYAFLFTPFPLLATFLQPCFPPLIAFSFPYPSPVTAYNWFFAA